MSEAKKLFQEASEKIGQLKMKTNDGKEHLQGSKNNKLIG